MWFGTRDGLNRYDGYRFTVFRSNPFDSTSLSNNFITEIFEDSRGRLWVGTIDGLNCFDPTTEKFRRFLHNPDNPSSLSGNHITAVCEAPAAPDADNDAAVFWVGTVNSGLNKLILREETFEIVRYQHAADDANSLAGNQIEDILVDRNGNLWIGTFEGLCRLDQSHAASSGIAGKAEFIRYALASTTTNFAFPKISSALLETSDGSIWVGLSGSIANVTPGSDSSGVWQRHDFSAVIEADWPPNEICEGPQGELWVATISGLAIFDPGNAESPWRQPDPEAPNGLSYHGLPSLFRDRSDAIWIGTSGYGLNRWDPNAKKFDSFTANNLTRKFEVEFGVSGVLEDQHGIAWIISNGIWLFNRKTGDLSLHHLNDHLEIAFGFHEDREGYLWIIGASSIFRYNRRFMRLENIFSWAHFEEGFLMRGIHEDRNGDIWFGAGNRLAIDPASGPANRPALYRWHRQAETMTEYPLPVPKALTGENLLIQQLIQDRDDVFWLATNRGLVRFEVESGVLRIFQNKTNNPESLSSNAVKTVLLDPVQPERFLWLGTDGGGLNRFDMVSEKFSYYMEEHGLPNNVVYGILADDGGNLWMSTNKGLSKAVTTEDAREILRFKNYDAGDGLQGNEFNTDAYFKNAAGEMFFGGVKGFTVFHPDSIRDNPDMPPIVFTDLQINYESVRPNRSSSPLQKTINTTERIVLSPEDKIIALEFAALDYAAPERNLYSYKLENFDGGWSRPNPVRRATYTNLPPGEYEFRVRGSNDDGVWNESGASVIIVVNPPCWKTWWAYTLYSLLSMIFLYGFRRYELSRMRLKDQVKLEKIEAQKLQELDQMKSRFFANISHEFRTPLTLILGPIDSMLQGLDNMVFKRNLHFMRKNAGKLLRLVNQLLDLAKLEAGKMQLRASRGDLVQCVKSVVAFFESLAERKNIALHFQSEPEQIEAWFNSNDLEKVFYNILSNAFKFTPDGGSVSVRLSVDEERIQTVRQLAGRWASISVKDSGVGVSTSELPFVFDRFYQAGKSIGNNSSVQDYEGTGIGLALVKELVELHYGVVRLRSEKGRGTEVVVNLPLGKAHLKPEEIIEKATNSQHLAFSFQPSGNKQPKTSGQQPAVNSRKPEKASIILVVEDNIDMRDYLRQHLAEAGYQVLEAANGQEGYETAVAQIPDLVISDVMMPKMDGYALCNRLKTDDKTSHIPVILLTAKVERDDKLEGLETGADAYLTKPFDARELQTRVKNLIALRSKLREKFRRRMILQPGEIEIDSIDAAFLEKAVAIVEKNLQAESFSVENLARQIGMSRMQLHRKLRALTNQSASHFICAIRVQRAAELIKKDAATITEIAYMVGFNSHPYFSKCFQEHFGMTPTEYKKQNG